jgi:hypothetical protein
MTPTATTPAPPAAAPARPAPAVVKSVQVVVAPAARPARFVSRNRAVVLFVMLLVIADLGIGALAPVWDRHSPDDYAARVTGCAARPRDLVFVGGSPVTEGIDPARIAGANWRGAPLADAYAVGLHGGTATDFYFAAKRACPTAPRVIVYGATASDLNDSRSEPHAVRTLLDRADVQEIARTRPDTAEWVTRHYAESKIGNASNLYRYRHGLRMWAAVQADAVCPGACPEALAQAREQRDHADDLATCGTGYAPLKGYARVRYDQLKAAGHAPPPFIFLNNYRTGSHLKFADVLADWCRARGTALVLLDMPVTADLEARYPREFAEYRARLAELARAHNLPVIRGADAGLTDADFADLIHMTPDGCAKFSRWLRGKLEEAGRAP